MTKRVLVTGAAGFIGRYLVDELKNRNFFVKGLVRGETHRDLHADEIVERNISTQTNWDGVFESIDCVVHMADGLRQFEAFASDKETVGDAELSANVHLAEHAIQAGVGKLIYVSSIKAMAGECETEVLTEVQQPEPTSLYGRLKLQMEQRLQALAASSGMELIVLRPPLVYGPDAGGNFARLLRLADSPWPLPLGGFENARSIIFVETLADVIATCVEREETPGETYLVHDGPAFSTSDLIVMLRKGFGRPTRLFGFPFFESIGLALGLREQIDRLLGSLQLDDTLFRLRFDWRPRLSSAEALKKTAAAFRKTRDSGR